MARNPAAARKNPACSTSTRGSRRAARPRHRESRQRFAAPAASARAPVATPSGIATHARSDSARQRHDQTVRLAGRNRPRTQTGPGQPVAGEARGHAAADQKDQHDEEAERRARRNFGETGARILHMERDVDEGEREDEPRRLQVAPVPARRHLAGDQRREDDEERRIDRPRRPSFRSPPRRRWRRGRPPTG